MTELSLGEAEALARKAARGAGFSWGMAEEAGRALRWLCARGLPGGAALAGLLASPAAGGPACPLTLGATFVDRSELARAAGTAEMETHLTVVHPLLFLPFAASVAARGPFALQVDWPDARVFLAGTEVRMARKDVLATADRSKVACREIPEAGAMQGTPLAPGHRADVAPEALAMLERLSARTYAPATPESRLAGAGAGLTDND